MFRLKENDLLLGEKRRFSIICDIIPPGKSCLDQLLPSTTSFFKINTILTRNSEY